jgi:type VI secretion system secreted protein VgrG
MQPSADSAWFNFTVRGGSFSVYSFKGLEEVSRPYGFFIELVSPSPYEDIIGLLGKPGCLSILDRTGTPRLVHGLVREMRQLHSGNLFTHYECVLAPRFDFLKDTCDHRIYQKKSVPDIITEILQEQGFSSEGFAFKCFGSFAPREYCVQYGESDFHFINRLCEEEGIYYYFEHSADGHCLCFSNMAGGPPVPGENTLRFFSGSGQKSDTAVIARLNLHSGTVSDTATYREWNFEQPKLDLTGTQKEADPEKAPVPQGMKLETYQYPHIYQEKDQASPYAQIQLLRQISFAKRVEGESDVSRFTPGYSFAVKEHPRPDLNAKWWVTRVEHRGEQPGVLEHEAPDDRGLRYDAHFQAIPVMTRFVPPLRHPKIRILGDQTAVVTGPEGEEIYTDKYGRVKVQFFWDRRDMWNEKTTCWIRVSQGWAGPKYGTAAIPRIGHEVVVTFLEGDPDRPLITGRVYHALNMPPYELPANKTRTVFRSMSTPGEENEERGFNEFRIEDKKGEEEIYVHAQKDVNVHVKNDCKKHIRHDRHLTVNNFSYTRVKGEEHLIIEKPRKAELLSEDHLTVKGDSHAEYETKWLVKIGQEMHFAAGDKVVIEARSDLTVKCGGTFIRLTPAGIDINSGKVTINGSGSPGSGSGASPELPEEAVGVDATGKPIAPEQRKGEEKEAQVPAPGVTNSAAIANLSSETIKLINQSPTLVDQINNNAVSIEYGPSGGGTYVQGNRIILDGSEATNPQASVQLIAHEMGHVTGPAVDKTNIETYLNSMLYSEGAATLNNMCVRKEILDSGGGDVGIAGNTSNHSEYTTIYNNYSEGTITRQEAQRNIGNIFGTKERPSTNPSINYETYYREQARSLGVPPASGSTP